MSGLWGKLKQIFNPGASSVQNNSGSLPDQRDVSRDRIVAIDLETTGLDPIKAGHRIVTFAGVECKDNTPTGQAIYLIFNPERKSDAIARSIHGFDSYTLAHQDKFADFAAQIRDWIGDSTVVAHNADFDVSFLNAEFKRVGLPAVKSGQVFCTMKQFRGYCEKNKLYPSSAKLDDAVEMFGIANKRGKNHNALDDAMLCLSLYFTLKHDRVRRIENADASIPKNYKAPPVNEKVNPKEVTREMAEAALEKYGTKTAAAKSLGVSVTTISNRLNQP